PPPADAPSAALASLAPAPSPAAPAAPPSRGQAGVVPPVVVRQDLPKWHGVEGGNRRLEIGPLKGTLEVSIDETGRVEAARLATPIHPFYDSRLIAAARGWQYRPATRDGVPVKYLKRIAIELVDRQAPAP
ncbi:MAG TPA: hypothetical protein VK911_14960, partial [Vicinamibacterales bacterium]|nr:hypothetical protein [Vicinamibacterales bacterium]